MDISSDSDGIGIGEVPREMRKLRKKLRQIENLETKFPYNSRSEAELLKISQKQNIREKLSELLSILPEQEEDFSNSYELSKLSISGDDCDDIDDVMKRKVNPDLDRLREVQPHKLPRTVPSAPDLEYEDRASTSGVAVSYESDSESPTESEGTDADAAPVGVGLSDAEVNNDRSADQLNTGRSAGQLNTGRSADQLNTGRSADQLNTGRSADQLNTGRSADQLNTGRSADELIAVRDTVRRDDVISPFRQIWTKTRISCRFLQGHNDVISCADCADGRLVTGGRDTMVKVWDLESGTELRSLGGHREPVTGVLLPPNSQQLKHSHSLPLSDVLVMSASLDCTLRLWSTQTGAQLASIYTYNPVTSLIAHPDAPGCVILGTDGGKIELWNCLTESQTFSTTATTGSVISLSTNSLHMVSGSSDGSLTVWLLTHNDLRPVFSSDPSNYPVLCCLLFDINTIYYGDSTANIKLLKWRSNEASCFRNHVIEFGFTDGLALTPDGLLLATAYDIDRGEGSINLRHSVSSEYLASVQCRARPAGRMLGLLATRREPSGSHRWVTFGDSLCVWDHRRDRVPEAHVEMTLFRKRLAAPPAEAQLGEDSEEDESDDSNDDSDGVGDTDGNASWRCALM